MENHANPIVRLTFNFSLDLIKYTENLEALKKYVISKQLLASGTSVGANVMEAQNAESKKDFIHKMKIAAKEILETEYWLYLCEKSEPYPNPGKLLNSASDIKRVLNKIISTTLNNISNRK